LFWFSDFNFSTLEILNLIFDFHLQWSFNPVGHTCITAIIADSVIRLDTLTFLNIFWLIIFIWVSDLNFSSFEISFLIFFFNDHLMQWIIQYMHTTATDADSVIRLDTYNFYNLTNLEIILIFKSLISIFPTCNFHY